VSISKYPYLLSELRSAVEVGVKVAFAVCFLIRNKLIIGRCEVSWLSYSYLGDNWRN
jgi:hypothetical protein